MNTSKTNIRMEVSDRCCASEGKPDCDSNMEAKGTDTSSHNFAEANEDQLLNQYIEFAEQLIVKAREYVLLWQYAQAEETYNEAFAILEQRLGPGHLTTIRCGKNLALLHQISGNDKKAETVYLNMISRLGNANPAAYLDAVEMLGGLAEIYEEQERHQDLDTVYRRLLVWKQHVLGSNSLEVGNLLDNLAKIACELGSVSKEEESLKAAFPIFRATLGPGNERTISCLKRLMSAQEKLRKQKEHSQNDIEWQG